MKWNKLWTVWFSPTGGTGTAASLLAGYLGKTLGLTQGEIDLTAPEAREREYRFGAQDLVVIGSPVYAGRLPNKIMPDYRRCLLADGAAAIPIVVYGNRSYGGALTELRLLLQENGFMIAGGAAVVSRHAFTDALAKGRPDSEDREEIHNFADRIAEKLTGCGSEDPVPLSPVSESDVPAYYTPLKEDGTPARFLKAKPETDLTKCDRCGICRDACPVGSIDGQMQTEGVCIKCQACIRKCPKQAKYFTDGDFLSHVRMLERDHTARAGNYFII